jgi:hypothetical protein
VPQTRTLAELYASQGLTERAIQVYQALVDQNPDEAELAARLGTLQAEVSQRSARQVELAGSTDGSESVTSAEAAPPAEDAAPPAEAHEITEETAVPSAEAPTPASLAPSQLAADADRSASPFAGIAELEGFERWLEQLPVLDAAEDAAEDAAATRASEAPPAGATTP